jgi:hypothetical protein
MIPKRTNANSGKFTQTRVGETSLFGGTSPTYSYSGNLLAPNNSTTPSSSQGNTIIRAVNPGAGYLSDVAKNGSNSPSVGTWNNNNYVPYVNTGTNSGPTTQNSSDFGAGAGGGSSGGGYSGASVPTAPTFNMPSTADLNNQYTSHYNTIMNALNPAISNLNQYNTQGQASLTQGEKQNVALGTSGEKFITNLTNNAVAGNNQQVTNAETGFSNAALASENSVAGLMKSAQGANIGALNANAGAEGFSSGINQAGDPYVRAEQAAMNQPYYQQLTNLNNQTLSSIQSNVSTLTGLDLSANVKLKTGEQTTIGNIVQNTQNNNTVLHQASATLNGQIAQDYTGLVTGAISGASNLEQYQTNLQASQWLNTVSAYQVSANLLNFINTYTVNSNANTINMYNAYTNRLNTLVNSVKPLITTPGQNITSENLIKVLTSGSTSTQNPFLDMVTGNSSSAGG